MLLWGLPKSARKCVDPLQGCNDFAENMQKNISLDEEVQEIAYKLATSHWLRLAAQNQPFPIPLRHHPVGLHISRKGLVLSFSSLGGL